MLVVLDVITHHACAVLSVANLPIAGPPKRNVPLTLSELFQVERDEVPSNPAS